MRLLAGTTVRAPSPWRVTPSLSPRPSGRTAPRPATGHRGSAPDPGVRVTRRRIVPSSPARAVERGTTGPVLARLPPARARGPTTQSGPSRAERRTPRHRSAPGVARLHLSTSVASTTSASPDPLTTPRARGRSTQKPRALRAERTSNPSSTDAMCDRPSEHRAPVDRIHRRASSHRRRRTTPRRPHDRHRLELDHLLQEDPGSLDVSSRCPANDCASPAAGASLASERPASVPRRPSGACAC